MTQKQEWITGLIDQDVAMFYTGQYKDGEHIRVYYEENNPSNYYVDIKQSELTTRLFFALLGLFMSCVGLYLMFK